MNRLLFFLLFLLGTWNIRAANVAYSTSTLKTSPTNLHLRAANIDVYNKLGFASGTSGNLFFQATNGSTHTTNATWNFFGGYAANATDTHPDYFYFNGYNLLATGRQNTNDEAFGFKVETHYEPFPGANQVEAYYDYYSRNSGYATNALWNGFRPWGLTVRQDNFSVVQVANSTAVDAWTLRAPTNQLSADCVTITTDRAGASANMIISGQLTITTNYGNTATLNLYRGGVFTIFNNTHARSVSEYISGSQFIWDNGNGTACQGRFFGFSSMLFEQPIILTDTYISRTSAGALAIGTASGGSQGNLSASNITLTGLATIPALKVGNANQATITNILSGSATLNFASQSVGGSEDLAITVTGAKDGDAVALGYESAVATGIIGSFSAWASNGVVFVRFISTGTTQNPASGVFRVVVTEF